MTAEEFYAARNDRSLRYAGRVLDPTRRITITGQRDYLESAAGQAAGSVAVNLLSRMTPSVSLGFNDTRVQLSIRHAAPSLHEFLMAQMRRIDPNGCFSLKSFEDGDYRVHLGSDGGEWVVHGSDWNAFVGRTPSPLAAPKTPNVFGGAFAAITAVAKIFIGPFPADISPTVVNLLDWSCEKTDSCVTVNVGDSLGHLWFVGAGSVGSAIAYFLALAGVKFEATIFDADCVTLENLDRSPVFCFEDVGKSKAEVVAKFLRARGISALAEPVWLDQSEKWRRRQQGIPDILISAANERNVRYIIESLFPPLQIYGTTGMDWQACVLRHIPPQDPCSCCVFPPDAPASTKCAEGVVTLPADPFGKEKQVDASLPFLSFAVGLMAAVEIVKLSIGVHGPSNRAFFTPCADEIVFPAPLRHRQNCLCGIRSSAAHWAMIAGSKYANLSTF
jgi:hypothetical protein